MVNTQQTASGFRRHFPILTWLPSYHRQWLQTDIIAGLTIMALLVPEGMAYAELAGVPPQSAFYAAPIGLILYAIFGSSRQLVVAVSAAIAVMSASIVSDLVPTESMEFIILTAGLAVLTGLIAWLAGLLRLGRIAQFFSESILVGFVSGLALVIMIKQIPKLFGLEAGVGNFWERSLELIRGLPEISWVTTAVGLSALVLMIYLEHRFRRLPVALGVMIYGIIIVSVFGLANQGVHIVGEIPAGLALPQIPNISLEAWLSLIPGAIALALVMFSEAVGPARSFAGKHHYEIDENQELIGLGMANMGAGLFQGFSIGVSLSKSAASDAAGGKTQMAGLIAALATALVALFFTPLFFNLPEACLAAIVIVAVSGMIKVQDFKRLYQLRRQEFGLALITFIGVLTFDEVLTALLLGVILSLLALVWRTSTPRLSILGRVPGSIYFQSVTSSPDVIQYPDILILRPDEALFFANASALRGVIRHQIRGALPGLNTTIIDLGMTNQLDVPSLEMLEKLYEEHEALALQFKLVGLHRPVRKLLDTSGVTKKIGRENIYSTILEAVLDHTLEDINNRSLTDEEVGTIISRIDTVIELFRLEVQNMDESHPRHTQLMTTIDKLKETRRFLGKMV